LETSKVPKVRPLSLILVTNDDETRSGGAIISEAKSSLSLTD